MAPALRIAAAVAVLALVSCSSTREVPDDPAGPGAIPSLREALPRLKLQLRRGGGTAACKSIGGGLEACPVITGEAGEVTFVGDEHLATWEAERRESGRQG